MPLHVLAGCRDLLRPTSLPGEVLATHLGPNLGIATADWLAPGCGQFHHDFLIEDQGDARVAVFARSLRDNFGSRTAPLVILPDLLEAEDGLGSGSLAVLLALRRQLPAEPLVLYAIALPAATGGGELDWAVEAGLLPEAAGRRLASLVAQLAAGGVGTAIETQLLTARPDMPLFRAFLRNALARVIAARAPCRLDPTEFVVDPARLEAVTAQLLASWDRLGIAPHRSIGEVGLDRLADRVLEALLDHGVPDNA